MSNDFLFERRVRRLLEIMQYEDDRVLHVFCCARYHPWLRLADDAMYQELAHREPIFKIIRYIAELRSMNTWQTRLTELWYFFIANLRASYFGVFLLSVFLLTKVVTVPTISRYDLIFLAAVGFQACALIFRFESLKEFSVILIFHLLATVMELFKTNPSIGSWTYPGIDGAVFALGSVPLFAGFLYSAIGSYISRAFVFLKLSYERFPAYYHLWMLAVLIYLNFFTHHFFYDIRYLLFAYVLVIFFKTKVHFQVYRKRRTVPFLLAAFLTALFVWIAENIGTFTSIWLYPSQMEYWHLVSFSKIGSWFFLLILSFALVSIIYRDKLRHSP